MANPGTSSLERRITVTAVVLPFVGFLAALWLLWGGAVTGLDLGIMAVMYILVGFGVTIGFHRLFTHRSFEAKPWLRALLAVLGSMSIQGAVIHWVADHRKHHTFTDEEGDPHSPHTHGAPGWRGVVKGLWHSHMGWLFDGERTSASRFAPDLKKDPLIRKIDSLFPVWALLGLAIPFLLGFALSGGDLIAGVTAFVWAGLVRVFLLHHATWSVNSICHMYGEQPFAIKDQSRNNWMVAFVSLGEGWHHSHHAFPTSARHGLQRLQFDPSFALISGFERMGWAWNVKSPKPEQVEAKRRTDAFEQELAEPPAPVAEVETREPVGAGDRA
ncbi:MAG: acyl-CoA desaturase [Solirubrobacterales bacterium]|jgi:stearoyl-CoA desaturase (delta-9 desaturase)|nr:acyl-CoA desaturase [Solirubrobacterales bacterium]